MDYIEMVAAIQTSGVLDRLSERERKAIMLRFGFEDGQPRELIEVAQELGMTSDEVREVEMNVLRKMRHPSRSALLKDYIEPVS